MRINFDGGALQQMRQTLVVRNSKFQVTTRQDIRPHGNITTLVLLTISTDV